MKPCGSCICKASVCPRIARRFQMGRMTVQKFAYADTSPETAAYRVKARMLQPYEAFLRERWHQGARNGAQLYREVVAMGYPGKRKQGARLVAHLGSRHFYPQNRLSRTWRDQKNYGGNLCLLSFSSRGQGRKHDG